MMNILCSSRKKYYAISKHLRTSKNPKPTPTARLTHTVVLRQTRSFLFVCFGKNIQKSHKVSAFVL